MQPDMELGAPAASGNGGNSVMYQCTAKGHHYFIFFFLSRKNETENCKYLITGPLITCQSHSNYYEQYVHKVLHKIFWQNL